MAGSPSDCLLPPSGRSAIIFCLLLALFDAVKTSTGDSNPSPSNQVLRDWHFVQAPTGLRNKEATLASKESKKSFRGGKHPSKHYSPNLFVINKSNKDETNPLVHVSNGAGTNDIDGGRLAYPASSVFV
uniref:Uncharacterized protein n=1 Tax=Timema cristinae TaxID=61476 RepID=A0A7R9CDB3_TIMCR|nr:unnamed protein product [Timema cristinae]